MGRQDWWGFFPACHWHSITGPLCPQQAGYWLWLCFLLYRYNLFQQNSHFLLCRAARGFFFPFSLFISNALFLADPVINWLWAQIHSNCILASLGIKERQWSKLSSFFGACLLLNVVMKSQFWTWNDIYILPNNDWLNWCNKSFKVKVVFQNISLLKLFFKLSNFN